MSILMSFLTAIGLGGDAGKGDGRCCGTLARGDAIKVSGRRISQARQAKLESLCHQLFQKEELVLSGRLQLLGLSKIKKRMGRRWDGMQQIVHDVCEESINKYLSAGDVSICHRDDSYVLLFATKSLAEIELRTMLIAEDIKKQLFDYDEFEDLEILNQIARIQPSNSMAQEIPFPDNIHHMFERSLGLMPQDLEFVDAAGHDDMSHMLKRTEVDAFAEPERMIAGLDLGVDQNVILSTKVCYMPVWDQYKKRLVAYMCLPVNPHYDGADPVAGYTKLSQSLSSLKKGETDMAVLLKVIENLGRAGELSMPYGMICPVHYETLSGVETRERYKKICQGISETMKQSILFMVMDVPPQTSWVSLSQIVSPLKTYGRVLCGQLPLGAGVDFESLRMSGFDNIGVIIGTQVRGDSIRKVMNDLRMFVTRAKKHLIYKTFVMGVNDPMTAASLAQTGVRYMAGSAVYETLAEPIPSVDFWGSAVFRSWQKTGQEASGRRQG